MAKAAASIFFDIGDSLIHVRDPLHVFYTNVINEVKQTEFPEEAIKTAMEDKLKTMQLRNNGHFRYSDSWFEIYIFSILDSIGCPKPWTPIMKPLFELFTDPATFLIYPDVVPCLEKVKSSGFTTAVVSNWGYRLPLLLERLNIRPYFDMIISSADVELEKPDPRIFELALSGTKSKANKTVHIGDHVVCDLEGSQAAGIHGLLLDRKLVHPEREDKIHTLSDLFPYLHKNNVI
ncbi:MAG: HAD-IA family hydrolase [Planctomycetota bacterium]